MSSIFRDMGLQQDDESVAIIRETLSLLPPNHPVRSYLAIARDLGSDAGLVDTFLHPRARSYTVEECIDLVTSAGLVFQSWFLNAPYYLHDAAESTGHRSALCSLSDVKHWSAMERIHSTNACHFFVACRPERSKTSYAINFSDEDSLEYVPHFRKGCALSGVELIRPDWRMSLSPVQLEFVRLVDGRRTIREISQAVPQAVAAGGTSELDFGRDLFRALWRLDFLAMALSRLRTR
ncbi:MAG: hypothetical protein ACRD6W_15615 [Nitrososphaerales archaeon]